MRIAYYTPWIYPWRVDLLDTLRKRGEQVMLYATGIFGNYPGMKKLDKHIHKIPSISFLGENIIHPELFFHVLLNKPDFLIIGNSEGLPSLLLYMTARVGKIPTLLLVEKNRDTRYLLPLPIRILSTAKRVLVKAIHKDAPILLAEAEATKDYSIQMGCHSERIHAYVHGVNTERFQPKRKNLALAQKIGVSETDLEKVVVLYLGGFNTHKGFEYLGSALLNSDFDNNIFIIPKYGSLLQDFESLLQRQKNVRLIPQISSEDMPELYSLADIVIHPPIVTASGSPASENVLLEAMACGTPVLATPVGGIPGIIRDGKTGFVLEHNSPECVAKNVTRALSYPHLDEVVANARNVVETEYTYEVTVERYKGILDRLRRKL